MSTGAIDLETYFNKLVHMQGRLKNVYELQRDVIHHMGNSAATLGVRLRAAPETRSRADVFHQQSLGLIAAATEAGEAIVQPIRLEMMANPAFSMRYADLRLDPETVNTANYAAITKFDDRLADAAEEMLKIRMDAERDLFALSGLRRGGWRLRA